MNIHSVPSTQIKRAEAIVLMYDVTCRASFEMLPKWLKRIEDLAKESTSVFILGNKNDQVENCVVSSKEQTDFQKLNRVKGFRLSSVKDPQHVNICLQDIFEDTIMTRESAKRELMRKQSLASKSATSQR